MLSNGYGISNRKGCSAGSLSSREGREPVLRTVKSCVSLFSAAPVAPVGCYMYTSTVICICALSQDGLTSGRKPQRRMKVY